VQASASPALAVLEEAAPLRELPRVAALITMAQSLLGAMEGPLSGAALRLGPSLGFALGAAVLGLGLAVLRILPPFPPDRGSCAEPGRFPWRQGLNLLVLALSVGLVNGTLLTVLPRLQPDLALASGAGNQLTAVLAVSALAATWGGRLASRWGLRRALRGGLGVLSVLIALHVLMPPLRLPLILLVGLVHSLVSTSLTATALATLPATAAGLGAGLVLGGSGAASSVLILVFGDSGDVAVAPLLAVVAGATVVALRFTAGPPGPSITDHLV
jgi:hypothetical protein